TPADHRRAGQGGPGRTRRGDPPAEVATALFLGTHPLPDGAADPPGPGALFKASFAAGMDGPLKGPFRKLFAAWLDSRRDPAALRAGMDAALFSGLSE